MWGHIQVYILVGRVKKQIFFLTTADEKIINVGMQRVLRCESWKVIVKVLHYGRGTTNNQQSK